MDGQIREVWITELEPRSTDAAEFEGREWDVTIIGAESTDAVVKDTATGREYVESRNGRLYDTEALEASVPMMWNGAKVYDNHLTDEEFTERQGMRSVAGEWIGTIVESRWDAAKRQVRGVLKVVEENVARKLKAAWDQGVLGTVGLSIDAYTEGREASIEGNATLLVEGIKKVLSVDLVAEPAAGGGFNRLIAAHISEEEQPMELNEELRAEIQQLVQSSVAETLAAAKDQESEQTEAEDAEEAEEAEEAEATEEAQEAGATETAEEPEEEEDEDKAEEAVEMVRKLECKLMLRDKLDAAKLAAPNRQVVEDAFNGRIFDGAEVDRMVKQLKEAEASFDRSGNVTGAGGERTTLRSAVSEDDRAEVELLRLLMPSGDFRNLESTEEYFVKERFTPAYQAWIKNGRPNYGTRSISNWLYNYWGGNPLVDRAREAVTTSSMSSIVKNTLNIMLANDYSKRQRWYEPIVTIEEVDNINTATLVRTYGLSSLSVVNEGDAYTELTWADEEETAAFVKKGNYAGVTMEAMLRDNVQAIRTLPRRLADSWHNTLSKLVSGVFTTNTATGPVLSDTGALFNATAVTTAGGHVNLLTTALSFTQYGVVRTAMMKQTDQDSADFSAQQGERLLITPRYLVVPVDLETTAIQIRNSEYIPASQNNDINPHYQKFDIVVDPHATDTNNWAAVADPREFPAIYLIFLRGRRVPELFTADNETGGSMFTNDTLRYKIRMLTWRFSSTYECAPVSSWRALHKSNV